ncbi:MAG: ribose 5-phosphate isomerase A, partial [Rhizobiales bacterium]|nr:ribose 5-phosphate isomerase A [Hyphomicrobiales bacterium]
MSGSPAAAKLAAAKAAVELVESGMKLGLGTGSTAAEFVTLLGERRRDGFEMVGVPTSEATAAQARSLGIELGDLDQLSPLDLTIDGADEIGPGLVLVKGGGGALLREKIVASAAEKVVIIVGEGKRVERLCTGFMLPVEITPFGASVTRRE